MTLNYKLEESDFLEFQLFTASKSKRIKKKKRNGWLLTSFGFLFIAILFHFQHETIMSIYFGTGAFIAALFYPKYFKWRYKKHYKAFIKEHYSNKFGHSELLEIREKDIFIKDKSGEGTLNLTEVEHVNGTNDYFYIKLLTGTSIIIPKQQVSSIENLESKFKSVKIEINNHFNWTW